ncbi:cobalamin B12-binding domain-containing protein [PVC group bacterium]|nr:cobalamin B12-binding domain-containing protein [PVC group bacterium]
MKILLISANVAKSPYPVYPLGLGMIAASLENAGHEVSQFDFLQNNSSPDAVKSAVRKNAPEIVGISLRNIDNTNALNEQKYVPCVQTIVDAVRAESECCVVLGGSGFSIMPEVILETVGADYGIVGEGEKLFVDFVNGVSLGNYPENRCIRSAPALCGSEIPGAHYDSHIMEFYRKSGNLAGIQTKRGCPHKCIYCSYPVLEGSNIRTREPAAVVADIRRLIDEHNAAYIFFTDSVFNDENGHFMDVVKAMHNDGINIPWTAFFKPGGLNDENVALMKETGLNAAEIGSDASSDAVLRKLGKNFLFEDIAECTALFARHGIVSANYFMFGCPGETKELVLEGISNIKLLPKSAIFIFMGIRILPGTALAAIAQKKGMITDDIKELLEPVYYMSPELDKTWLENTLTEAFAELKHCIFPPDSMDSALDFLHKMGQVGPLWDLLLKERKRRIRK